MNVRPAGREACSCASPYNSILERLTAMEAEILAVQATANSAMGVANAQAGAAASSASAAAASATAAGNAAISAASDASDALTQATAAAGSADDAANSAADALTALQTIEGTIASVLASDLGGKVDKLTTAGFYLYMHNGSTQGEVQPVVAPTAATIPIRDSDGRMQAADPASGATDKTLVTANWVSQTGDSAPNNLVHRSGNETKSGKFTMNDGMIGYQNDWHQTDKSGMNLNDYCIFAKIPGGYGGRYLIIDFCQSSNTACAYGRLMLRRNASAIMPVWLYRKTNGANDPLQSNSIHVLHDGTDIYLAWKKLAPYGSLCAALTFDISYGTVQKVSNQNMTWYTTAQMIVTNDISSYTDVTVVE